jgi:hypothetical protein
VISFRFHLVSLIGVFLALSVGIAIGATVVDQATVDQLQRQVRAVDERARATNAANDRLRADVQRWERFAEEAGDELVEGRLAGTDVLLVGVHGVDRDPVDRLRQSIEAAGARVQGTVWFTSKLKLEDPGQVSALAEALGVAPASADLLRRTVIDRMASQWANGNGPSVLDELQAAGFVELDVPAGSTIPVAAVPVPGSRFVLVSGAKADVPNEQLAVLFTAALAAHAPFRVLAAEAGRDATDRQPAERALFVGPLRDDGDVSARLSTVDNLESYRGRLAAVLALDDLGPQGKVGHFGVGHRATRLVPEPAS